MHLNLSVRKRSIKNINCWIKNCKNPFMKTNIWFWFLSVWCVVTPEPGRSCRNGLQLYLKNRKDPSDSACDSVLRSWASVWTYSRGNTTSWTTSVRTDTLPSSRHSPETAEFHQDELCLTLTSSDLWIIPKSPWYTPLLWGGGNSWHV